MLWQQRHCKIMLKNGKIKFCCSSKTLTCTYELLEIQMLKTYMLILHSWNAWPGLAIHQCYQWHIGILAKGGANNWDCYASWKPHVPCKTHHRFKGYVAIFILTNWRLILEKINVFIFSSTETFTWALLPDSRASCWAFEQP